MMHRPSLPIIPLLILAMPMLLSADLPAMQGARPRAEFALWPNGAPLAHGNDPAKDIPSLTPYWASDRRSGAAMVICPGGGYASLAPYEGKDYAEFLAKHGIASFVLKYRLGSNGYHHPAIETRPSKWRTPSSLRWHS